MGNDISTARYTALGSFLINFGTQVYGMVSKPNMKQIADANHFAFSPNPWFIAAFFSGQMILQAAWIRKLFQLNPDGYKPLHNGPLSDSQVVEADKVLDEQAAIDAALKYVPIYALGNVCIAGWLLFWLRGNFVASQALVTINTAAQLYAVSRLPPETESSPALLRLTHLVAKTFAGIGVLDFVDNGAVALRYRAPPSVPVQALTYSLFPVAAAISSPIFGSILAYDLAGVYVGQRFGAGPAAAAWGNRVGITTLVVGGISALKALRS